MSTPSTKDRLVAAALTVVAREGISGASARVIAAEADVNQALVFYHHASVEALLAEASRKVSTRRAARYAQRLTAVMSFTELSAIARELHDEERHSGELVVLTQLLAGARSRPAIAGALRDNFELLVQPIEQTLARLVRGTALEEVLAVPELARSIAGGVPRSGTAGRDRDRHRRRPLRRDRRHRGGRRPRPAGGHHRDRRPASPPTLRPAIASERGWTDAVVRSWGSRVAAVPTPSSGPRRTNRDRNASVCNPEPT